MVGQEILRACPLCGGEAKVYIDQAMRRNTYAVECDVCKVMTMCQDTRDGAVYDWNHRPKDDKVSDLVFSAKRVVEQNMFKGVKGISDLQISLNELDK